MDNVFNWLFLGSMPNFIVWSVAWAVATFWWFGRKEYQWKLDDLHRAAAAKGVGRYELDPGTGRVEFRFGCKECGKQP